MDQIIFRGAPSQACNFPALLKGGAVMATIGGIHLFASGYFPLQWPVLLAQAGAVLVGASIPFVKTAFTRIVIDTTRITWTQGIFKRRASTLELSRIQTVTSVYPWWQRMVGVGTLMLTTNDTAHPVKRLPGMRGAELLREQLVEAIAARRAGSGQTGDLGPDASALPNAHI